MPLSEHEQKLLDQMERAILTEDPRFASTFRDTIKHVGKKSEVVARPGLVIAGILFGIASLLAGVMISQPLLGVLGFVSIVLSVSTLFSGKAARIQKKNTTATKSRKSFMQGFEDRWDKRSDN
jgi:hypothetical protein